MKKKIGIRFSLPLGIGIGILVSMAITLIGAMVCAWLIAGERIGEGSASYAALVILGVASAVGAIVSGGLAKEKRMIVCAAAGAGYYLCLIAGTALFFGGRYEGLLPNAIAVLIGTAVAILAGFKTRKGPKRKVKIPAYR